jgi:integrase
MFVQLFVHSGGFRMSAARISLKQVETDISKAIDEAVAAGKGKVWTGNSLFLWVRGGSASWLYHYRDGRSMRTQSLGTYPDVTLYSARQARNRLAAQRRDDRRAHDGHRLVPGGPSAATLSGAPDILRKRFADVVEMFVTQSPMAADWKATSTEPHKYRKLKDGALGKMWTDAIEPTDVAAELKTRWGHTLGEADKNRIRIKQICDYARSNGYRAKNAVNPANNDDMKNLIAKPPKSTPHPAMPLGDVPAFMGRLLAKGTDAARATAFLIHTVARTAEARLADWSEIKDNVWTIPGPRMKEGKEHSVPLSPAALAVLGKPAQGRIFPELDKDDLLDKVKEHGGDYTTHGFRSAFNGWAKKQGYSKELRDLAMAHAVGTKTDQAYDREELIEERRPMMQAWSDYVSSLA